MTLFPTNGQKANFTATEEVTSQDLNSISTLVHQLAKDFNVNVFQGKQTGYAYPGCILSGCKVSITPGAPASVVVSPGILMFSLDTDPKNYSGSLLQISSTPLSVQPPTSGVQQYFIDVTYTEGLDPTLAYRNVYSQVTQTSGLQSIPTLTSSIQTPSTVVLSLQNEPSLGYTRLGQFSLDSSGAVYSAFTYALPFVWNVQNWPGTPHASNLNTTMTLADSLSAIRAALAEILGPSSKWYDAPITDIQSSVSTITAMNAQISSLQGGVRDIKLYGAGSGNITIAAGVTRLWVRCWGAGGNGGSSSYFSGILSLGGGGGGGGYCESFIPVSTGNIFPYVVGSGGSLTPTTIDFSSIGATLMSAGAGTNGQVGLTGPSAWGGTNGVGGVATGGTINIRGTNGTNGGYIGGPADANNLNARLGMTATNGGFSFNMLGEYGHGGFGGPSTGGAGSPGGSGCLLVYFM